MLVPVVWYGYTVVNQLDCPLVTFSRMIVNHEYLQMYPPQKTCYVHVCVCVCVDACYYEKAFSTVKLKSLFLYRNLAIKKKKSILI